MSTPTLSGQWMDALEQSKAESLTRRNRVLAHPDLAERLTEPPMSLTDPNRWSGWIPPRTLPEDACTHCAHGQPRPVCAHWPHSARVNTSPIRRQLVEIATEAYDRELDAPRPAAQRPPRT